MNSNNIIFKNAVLNLENSASIVGQTFMPHPNTHFGVFYHRSAAHRKSGLLLGRLRIVCYVSFYAYTLPHFTIITSIIWISTSVLGKILIRTSEVGSKYGAFIKG